MRIPVLFFLLLLSAGVVKAQTLFLPQNLNTPKNDHPVEFADYHGAYYFVGTQWPTQAGAASSGFCYQTDSVGNVLQTFQLNGLDSSKGYTFEAIYGYDDQIYIIATEGLFQNENSLSPASEGGYDNYFYNKILVLRFNLQLRLNRVDTLKYDADSSDIQSIKSVRIGSKIFMSYSTIKPGETIWGSRGYLAPSFLTAYNTNSSTFTQQPFDSAYVASYPPFNSIPLGNDNYPASLTATGDNQLLIGGSFTVWSRWHTYLNVFQIDTNLNITNVPFATSYTFQPRGVSFISEPAYVEMWKPTATSSYFAGPVFFQDTSANSGCQGYGFSSVARLDAATQTIAVGTQVLSQHPGQESYWQSSKKPMTLLRDKRHFVLSGLAILWDSSWRLDTSYIWVSKYDTSLNLIWTRNFGKPAHFFNAAGVHELQDGRLMMIAAATDTTNSALEKDLYCFIIDSNGTPLNTFTLASPAQKGFKIYPNPAHDVLRFEMNAGQAPTPYRVVDIQGKVLLEGNVLAGNPVSVSALPPASYILQAQGSDGVWRASLFTKE